MSLALYVFLVILLPVVSAVGSVIISERYRWVVSAFSAVLLFGSFLLACAVFAVQWNQPAVTYSTEWFVLGDRSITADVLLDSYTVLLLLLVTGISFLVHVFSIGYMAGDHREQQYYAFLGLFTATMLAFVLAGNLLLLFIFWELIGFCSYMLIGHWREKPEAATAARKAFMINRIADLGFVVGLLIYWSDTGTFSINSAVSSPEIQTWASLCFLIGVMGKSAQFPFFNWLPDAMQGPTPVSALIHAATMVVAGIFLLLRLQPIFSPLTGDIMMIVGAITALAGALSALHQFDVKRILAYSTISQLGFMLLALGAGTPAGTLLHLFTHAFFKAGLFLSVGAILHSMHHAQRNATEHYDVQDIRNLGNLRKHLPITFICFTACAAALVGLPFFSGFQSKDAILTAVYHWALEPWKVLAAAATALTVLITVAYTVRLWWFAFIAPAQKASPDTPTEVPVVMQLPMLVLALSSLWWIVSINPFNFSGWIFEGLNAPASHGTPVVWLSATAVPITAVLCILWFRRSTGANAIPLLREGFYLDTMNRVAAERPTLVVSTLVDTVDRRWIDAVLHGLAYVQVTFAYFVASLDKYVVDGIVHFMAGLALMTGRLARSFSNGKIQTYILLASLSLIIFLFWVLL